MDFALHDNRNLTPRANNLVAKKAVLQRIIPELQNSEAVKRAEADTVRNFTRCSIEKVVSREASYQYIDNDVGEIVIAKEYERRYNMYLDMKRRERARKHASPVKDPTSVCSSPKRTMPSPNSRSPVEISEAENKENDIMDNNVLVNLNVGAEKEVGKNPPRVDLLQSALWANVNSLISTNHTTSTSEEKGPVMPAAVTPNSLVETTSSPEQAVSMGEQGFDDEDTVDFKAIKLTNAITENMPLAKITLLLGKRL